MEIEERVEALRGLAQMAVDAAGACDLASRRVLSGWLALGLRELRAQHLRQVEELNVLIVRYGGHPVTQALAERGTLLQGVVRVSLGLGEETTLGVLLRNEELTDENFRSVLCEAWDDDDRELLVQLQSGGLRHLAWMREVLEGRPDEADASVPG